MPIIGIISGWPIWLLAIVSAVVAFLWLTIVARTVKGNRPTIRQKVESVQIATATSNSAAATGSGTAINAPGAGQVIGRIEAGRDVIINPLSSMSTPPDTRDYVRLTPDELTQFFRSDQTTVQSKKIVEPFIGKWMRVEGDLGDVSSYYEDIVIVSFANSGFTGQYALVKTLPMLFSGKKWSERLYVLKKGTHLVVRGQIKSVTQLGVSLENCELIQ